MHRSIPKHGIERYIERGSSDTSIEDRAITFLLNRGFQIVK